MGLRRILGGGLAILAFSAVASVPTPLKCPHGTHLAAAEKMRDGGTRESCVDDATGLREGPQRELREDGSLAGEGTNHAGKKHGAVRLYDADGTLMGEMLYDRGEVKSMHLSLTGLRMMVDKQNAAFAAASKPYHLSVIDERTLAFDLKVERESPSTPEERSKFQETFRGDPKICRIFSGMGIDVIKIHIETVSGAEIGDFATTSADCGATERPN